MPDLSKSLKAEHWPEVIDGVLFWQFWQRVSVHTSKKYSPFFYCTIDTPFCQSIYDITLQIMKKLRILQTLIPLNLFFIQRYQLEKLPMIRPAETSKLLWQNNRQLLTCTPNSIAKYKRVRKEKAGNSVINIFDRTLSQPSPKLVFVISSIKEVKLYARNTTRSNKTILF